MSDGIGICLGHSVGKCHFAYKYLPTFVFQLGSLYYTYPPAAYTIYTNYSKENQCTIEIMGSPYNS